MHSDRSAVVIAFSTTKTVIKTRWDVANKVDNLVIGIFDYTLRIYLCINTGISVVLGDSEIYIKIVLEVGANMDMGVDGGVGVL